MNRKAKVNIAVSNPGKQYTHQLLFALQKKNYKYQFYTSFWYKPIKFPFTLIGVFPESIRTRIKKQFQKRYDERLIAENVIQYPFFEIIREISDKIFAQRFAEQMLYWRERIHDRLVAKSIKHSSPNILIGYEESCVLSFREAKKKGIITVLDLAQVHYRTIEKIAYTHPAFGDLYKNKSLRKKINAIKEEELQLADYIICLSDFAKQTLIANGISGNKIFISSLGFDPKKFTQKETFQTGAKLKLIYTGTMTNRKGLDILLKVAKELQDSVELHLVGPMADSEKMMKIYEGYYHYHGMVDHDQLNQLLRSSDLFVFPSYLDSWAMVVVEAMACGLPVIVSDHTGAKEAIGNKSGFIIPAGNEEALREKILYFYHNSDEISKMGLSAQQDSLNHTWEHYYHKIGQIIHHLTLTHEE